MPRKMLMCTALLLTAVAFTCVDGGDPCAAADTAPPNVAGTWRGSWRQRSDRGRLTLSLAQKRTQVMRRQSLVSVAYVFSRQSIRRIGQQVRLGRDIRDGHLEDSTLMFHVVAPDLPIGRVNFTLTISGETMTGTMCAD